MTTSVRVRAGATRPARPLAFLIAGALANAAHAQTAAPAGALSHEGAWIGLYQQPDSQVTAPPAAADVLGAGGEDDLHVAVAAYAWLTSVTGTVGVADLEFDIKVDFTDIVDGADTIFGLMGAIDGEYKRLVFEFDTIYATAEASASRSAFQSVQIDAETEMDSSWTSMFGGYRFVDKAPEAEGSALSRFTLDAFVGGRLTVLQVDTSVSAEAMLTLPNGTVLEANRSRSLDETEAWFEPLVGSRIGLSFGEHWSLHVRGDVGGFGIDGSDFSWQASALLGYLWRRDGWDIAAFAGYRALGQDYSNDGFTWDVIVHGPMLGATAIFSF